MTAERPTSDVTAAVQAPSGIVTLLTDFGDADVYVAAMKGMLLSRAAGLTIVDMTHRIPAQDVLQGALAWADGWRTFPAGTVHVGVVDPGVGSDRAIIAARCQDHFFVAPNNGLLSGVFRDSESIWVHRVTCADRFQHPVSQTFHGRDIMAPVAALLAQNGDLAAVGPRMDRDQVVVLDLPHARVEVGGIVGAIVAIDGFGNAITNITESMIRALGDPSAGKRVCHLDGHVAIPVGSVYVDVPPGRPVAVMGSNGCIEIAVNGGNAASELGCDLGDPVRMVLEMD